MEAEMLAGITQFGTAGLVGWLWLSERRAAATREREVTELVERIRAERAQLDAVIGLIRENTRVLSLVDAGQQRLCAAVERLEASIARPRGDRGAATESMRAHDGAKWARGTGADQPVGVVIQPPPPDRERDRV